MYIVNFWETETGYFCEVKRNHGGGTEIAIQANSLKDAINTAVCKIAHEVEALHPSVFLRDKGNICFRKCVQSKQVPFDPDDEVAVFGGYCLFVIAKQKFLKKRKKFLKNEKNRG